MNDLTLRSRGNGVVGGAEERLISSRRFDENVGESESPERHHDTGAVERDDESREEHAHDGTIGLAVPVIRGIY